MGQLLATMGRCEEAESVLKMCASLDGSRSKDPVNHETSRVSALVTLGKLHADRGRYLDAVQAYKHAVTVMPPYYNSRVSVSPLFVYLFHSVPVRCDRVSRFISLNRAKRTYKTIKT